ncbi:hypothetical protein Scep_015001 [Stephania cephalantha]|uniref:Uncharacterized protein n=1 Tax=Stephania cephalantha TaxID=152367 RepID=A0AAP0J353_9MAGN
MDLTRREKRSLFHPQHPCFHRCRRGSMWRDGEAGRALLPKTTGFPKNSRLGVSF